MIERVPETPFGYTVFCDDIRQETAGKLTLVGTYGHHMIIHEELPVVLPKLGLWVHYYERPGESDEPAELLIYLPGDDEPVLREPIDLTDLRAKPTKKKVVPKALRGPDPWDPLMPARAIIVFAPCTIKAEGPIRVRVKRGKKTYRMGSLLVTVQPPVEHAEPASSEPEAMLN